MRAKYRIILSRLDTENKFNSIPGESQRNLDLTSGSKLEQLNYAIISAYPNKADLEMMLSFYLNESLDSIAGGGNIKQIVFELKKWAQSRNNLEQLI